jgi:hypothetical protein
LAGSASNTGATGATGPGFSITGAINILTATGYNQAIGQSNLTYNSVSRVLDVGTTAGTGTVQTSYLQVKSLALNNTSKVFLVADGAGNVGYNNGGNYPGTNYKETITFSFVGNNITDPYIKLVLGDNNMVVFNQVPTLNISFLSICYSSLTAGTFTLTMYDITGALVTNTSTVVLSPLNISAGSTNVLQTYDHTISPALTTGTTRALKVVLNSPSNNRISVYSILLGFAA